MLKELQVTESGADTAEWVPQLQNLVGRVGVLPIKLNAIKDSQYRYHDRL